MRIMERVQAGYSFEAIAREEALTRERIRQIVAQSVRVVGGERVDLPRIQITRLEPALRLAAEGVAKGQLAAISPLLKILAQIDKYNAEFSLSAPEEESVREKLLLRLDRAAAAMLEENRRAEQAARENLESGDPHLELPVTA